MSSEENRQLVEAIAALQKDFSDFKVQIKPMIDAYTTISTVGPWLKYIVGIVGAIIAAIYYWRNLPK